MKNLTTIQVEVTENCILKKGTICMVTKVSKGAYLVLETWVKGKFRSTAPMSLFLRDGQFVQL